MSIPNHDSISMTIHRLLWPFVQEDWKAGPVPRVPAPRRPVVYTCGAQIALHHQVSGSILILTPVHTLQGGKGPPCPVQAWLVWCVLHPNNRNSIQDLGTICVGTYTPCMHLESAVSTLDRVLGPAVCIALKAYQRSIAYRLMTQDIPPGLYPCYVTPHTIRTSGFCVSPGYLPPDILMQAYHFRPMLVSPATALYPCDLLVSQMFADRVVVEVEIPSSAHGRAALLHALSS